MWPGFAAELEALRRGAVQFEDPTLIGVVLLACVLLLAIVLWRGPRRLAVPASDASSGRRAAPVDLVWLLSWTLRGAALALAAATLARPVGLVPENPAGGSGYDMVIALDASGSMRALDAQLEGRRVTRLELARKVVADFVRERSGDRIALVVFGEHAFTQCPLTVDHRLVLEALDRVDTGVAGDSTALGEAIGLAARRLRVRGAPEDGSRILVLFTDGRHNSGRLGPETAANLARHAGVRIHAVGIGTDGPVPFAKKGTAEPMRFETVDLDRDTLARVAGLTGGRFFHARQPEDLEDVIEAIGQIEARPRGQAPRYRKASLAPWGLGSAWLLLLIDALLCHGLLRRLP